MERCNTGKNEQRGSGNCSGLQPGMQRQMSMPGACRQRQMRRQNNWGCNHAWGKEDNCNRTSSECDRNNESIRENGSDRESQGCKSHKESMGCGCRHASDSENSCSKVSAEENRCGKKSSCGCAHMQGRENNCGRVLSGCGDNTMFMRDSSCGRMSSHRENTCERVSSDQCGCHNQSDKNRICGTAVTTERGGCDCQDSRFSDYPVAMAYVPWQEWNTVYPLNEGLQIGTIFPCLDKPFIMGGCAKR